MDHFIRTQRANTILYCRRWPETVSFYRNGLALPVVHATDFLVEFQLTPDSFVSVADAGRATIDSAGGIGLTLAWQVEDVAAVHRGLEAKGITVGPLQVRWGARVFYFHDPEGHRIEIWSP
jgi:catechol 2,3-dioxygenase-like lactoylglutathione lyase family enzyme